MECATVSCEFDGYCVTLGEARRKARKIHRCTECRQLILPGQQYLEERTLWEGRVEVHKTCGTCENIRDNFFKSGWLYGEINWALKEHIHESYGDVSESCIAELTPAARDRVCSMIEEYFDEQDDEE